MTFEINYGIIMPIKLGKWCRMNKEEILAAARRNKQRGCEFENRVTTKSSLLGFFIALILSIFLFFFEYFFDGTANWGLVSVVMTAAGVQSLFEGIKMGKKYSLIIGILMLVLAVVSVIFFIKQVVLL